MCTLIVTLLALASAAHAFSPSSMRAARTSKMSGLQMADIVDTAVGAGSFNTLAAALTAAGLVPTLKGPGPFTVFAPTDEAFAKLPAGTVEALLKDIPKLTSILTYHVVPGNVLASTVVTLSGKKVATVNGAEVAVSVNSAGVKVNAANVVTTDIVCDNGVIHVIDSVLIPAAPVAPAAPAFNPKLEAGVSGPFGFFDPIGLCPTNKLDFMKFRESELKHGRIAMLAVLGVVIGESGFSFFEPGSISGPAIFQYQQADALIPAWTANVVGFTAAIEGFNIFNGWETFGEYEGVAGLKASYTNGDLKFDPLGLKPKNAKDLKEIQTKEINNGRLAMLAIAGIVAQELVTGSTLF
jgi:uncharacterized surface protein with fasciclin (FAS1) repeats